MMKIETFKDPYVFTPVLIGAIFSLCLFFLVNDRNLSALAFIISLLIPFTTAGIKNDIYKSYNDFDTYIKVLKSPLNDIYMDNYRKIFDHSMSLKREEQEKIRDMIMHDCVSGLEKLTRNEVDGTTFYSWLNSATQKIRDNGNMKNICKMKNYSAWEYPHELRYYNENRKASLNKGVTIERIFAMDANNLSNKEERKIIIKHIVDKMKPFIVSSKYFDELRLENISIFDDNLILSDRTMPDESENDLVGGTLMEKSGNEIKFERKMNMYNDAQPPYVIEVDTFKKLENYLKTINLELDKKPLLLDEKQLLKEADEYIKKELIYLNESKDDEKNIKDYYDKLLQEYE